MIEGFASRRVSTGNSFIQIAVRGSGPPLLLLHGFPQTLLMWRSVAPMLLEDFTTICADLPGQGGSGVPAGDPDSMPFSKRAMGRALVDMMRQLGFERFAVAGHDRGGRVAYRMALDQPASIAALAVLDVVPISDAFDRADSRLALAFWPWSLLSQPSPLPERLIGAAPEAIVDDAATQWGSPPGCFPDWVREAYVAPLRDPRRVHAICEEFRSAATIDRQHDRADRDAGRTIACPTLLLWDGAGAVGSWYEDCGGPLEIWRRWAKDVTGRPMTGGHFFPESRPGETASELRSFFLTTPR